MQSFGKYLIIFGIIIIVIGLAITFFPKANFFGKLPGDIEIKKENFTFYFPVVTCIVISIFLTLLIWLINFFRK
jgi:hypothetical protein